MHKRPKVLNYLLTRLYPVALVFFMLGLFLIPVFFSGFRAEAATSSTVNFQGRLLNKSGNLVADGNYNLEFKLYDAVSGGTALWTEIRDFPGSDQRVRVVNGYFSVNLGDVNSFPSTIDWTQEHWLTMNVGGGTTTPNWDGEMSPRVKLTAVPYSFRSAMADALKNGAGSLTASDLLHKAPSAVQNVNSTVAGLRIDQTGTGGLVQLQGDGTDVFTIDKVGNTYAKGSLDVDGALTAGGGNAFSVNTSGDITSVFTALNGTSTANGAALIASTTLDLTDATNFDVGNYVQVNSANCGGTGINPCYAKITAKATNTLTITPALSWASGSTVNEYHVPELGGTDTAQTLANRYGRGYFIAGIAAGNGTTYYNENSIETSLASFDLLNTGVTTLNIGGAATTISLGSSSTNVNLPGTLSLGGTQRLDQTGALTNIASLTGSGALTVSSGGSGDLTFDSASNKIVIASTDSTIQRIAPGTTTLDLSDASANTVFSVTNSDGTRVAGLNVEGSGTFGTGLVVTSGGLNLTSSGITNAGSIAGASTITASGLISANGGVTLGASTSLTVNGDAFTDLTGNGLSISGGALQVVYGPGANNAAAGANTFTCASGTGNLAGGGTVVTIGTSGTTCAGITTNAAVSFETSVTTPLLTSAGALGISSTATAGADDIIFSNAGTESLRILENGDLKFERGTDDAFFSIATPSGAPATYTFSGATGTVLTTANFAAGGGLDAAYVNVGESPATGDITGSFSGGLNVGANAVDLGTDTTGNYVASLGTLTGLTLNGANTGEGSTPGLTVLYGSGANNAAAGANTFICPSGNGNLTGGGTTVTIGTSGTTCGAISTNNAVTFSTSVTSPIFTGTGAVNLSSGGSSGLTLDSASNTISIAANDTTLQRVAAGTYTIDLSDASATTLRLTNSGTGVANLDIFKGGLSAAGTTRLTNGGALQNITGLTITSGGASITGALNLNSGGITNTGSIAGATTVNASGLVTSVGLTAGSGLIQGTGGLTITGATNINTSGATAVNIGNASTPLTITSTGFKTTSAGALSGITTLNASGNITGGSLTAGNGANRSCSNSQFINGMTVTDGIVTATNGCTAPLSDARLKQNVVSLDNSILSRIKDVNTVNFDFDCSNSIFDTSKADGIYCDSQRQTGVIAQELATIFPELVHQYDNGYYWADYEGLSIYTLKAVTEMAKFIDASGSANFNSLSVKGTIEAGTIRADHIEGLDYIGRFETLESRVNKLEKDQSTSTQNIDLDNLEVGKLTASSDLLIKGSSRFAKAANFDSTLSVSGQTNVQALSVNLGLIAKGALEVNGKATFKEVALFQKDAQFDGQINVLGYANTQGLTVNLDLIVKGAMQIDGQATFKEVVKFEKDAEFGGNVSVKGQTTFDGDTAGYAVIKQGENKIEVKFKNPKAQIPVITLSLGDGKFAQYSYRNVTEEGFEIILLNPAIEDLNFSWIALQTQPEETAAR